VRFKVEGECLATANVSSLRTSVDLVNDIAGSLRDKPFGLVYMGIDIPIGLFDVPKARECDREARKLLGKPRSNSVFPAPSRAALKENSYKEASEVNRLKTDKKLTKQTWGIMEKIRQVDDAIDPCAQAWAFEVHPEVCFWAMNERQPMKNSKKTKDGIAERTELLARFFPQIESNLESRLSMFGHKVGKDDLLDAAAAAWTALRRFRQTAECACTPECDAEGLSVTIYY